MGTYFPLINEAQHVEFKLPLDPKSLNYNLTIIKEARTRVWALVYVQVWHGQFLGKKKNYIVTKQVRHPKWRVLVSYIIILSHTLLFFKIQVYILWFKKLIPKYRNTLIQKWLSCISIIVMGSKFTFPILDPHLPIITLITNQKPQKIKNKNTQKIEKK